ncbi:MAG: methylated-DNA--[protein]-cysteine S-methyltransferase [Bdellovibrionales bacterium]|nr:methylated-DNA--[protein]-cysteine S-methyltransferase [Bdellovibrionales bacterium]
MAKVANKLIGKDHINYERIEKAIIFINENFQRQPSLAEVAAAVHLSPAHFQRLFSWWAGVSPKKFIQYLSLDYAKERLKNGESSLLDTAYETGLSGTGRLHDLFINIEGMTPGEYKSGGEGLSISYSFASSPFGQLIVGSTSKGICHLFFENDNERALKVLGERFPNAVLRKEIDENQKNALRIFREDWQNLDQIKLHLAGTPFQIKVWESLLRIPLGEVKTYGGIAREIGNPKSSRAVGTAIGSNPVAFLIPCHRVIQSSGKLGGYMWGVPRKSAILGWEAAKVDKEDR